VIIRKKIYLISSMRPIRAEDGASLLAHGQCY